MAAMKWLVLLLVVTLAHTRSHHKKERKLRPSQRNQRVGECSTSTMTDTFDIHAFCLQSWYEIYRVDYPLEEKMDCVMFNFFLSPNKVDLAITGRFANHTTGDTFAEGPLTITQNETILNMQFPRETQTYKMVVLDTDFDNYAILYACNQIEDALPPLKDERAWVLSRKKYFDKPVVIKIQAILDKLPEDIDKLLKPVYTFCKEGCDGG